MLLEIDRTYLDEQPGGATVTPDSCAISIVIHDFALPRGFTQPAADLLIRLSPGYPDVAPDMWWFDPPVQRVDGLPIAATDSRENYVGRVWQRWSRHLGPGQWKSGVDSLQSYVAIVRSELRRAARPQAA